MKLADYSQVVTADQLDKALRAGGFDGVFHYLAGTPGFALRIEHPAVVSSIRKLGWPQAGIDIPRSPADVDGEATAVRARDVYGCLPGFRIFLDIEPLNFDADRFAWPLAADRWCDQIRAAGMSPGIYGTDDTVAACANHADAIWRAKPGECDPAGPRLDPTFFAGRRAIQCSGGVWGGVEFDVSYSQFSIAGDDFMANGPLADPNTQQNLIDGVTRIITLLADGEQAIWDPVAGRLKPVPADWPNWLPVTLAALEAKVATPAPAPAVDVNALAAALVAAPGFTDALASAVLRRLGAALDRA